MYRAFYRRPGVLVSCWLRAWRNPILHLVNYKLFTLVISVWDTLTIGLCVTACRASGIGVTPSRGILSDVRWSLGEDHKAPWCDRGEDLYHQAVGAFRRVTLWMSPGQGLSTGWLGQACRYTILRNPSASDTSLQVPQFSKLERSAGKSRIYNIKL